MRFYKILKCQDINLSKSYAHRIHEISTTNNTTVIDSNFQSQCNG